MIFKYFHLGLRQVVMALMGWAIDVPQELLQSDAKTGPRAVGRISFYLSTPYLGMEDGRGRSRIMFIIVHFFYRKGFIL